MTKTYAPYTPEPWEVVATVSSDRKHIFGGAKNHEYYVGTLTSGSQKDLTIFKANVRLIAAAPELLEALDGALYALDENMDGSGPSREATIKQARIALAKARGRS